MCCSPQTNFSCILTLPLTKSLVNERKERLLRSQTARPQAFAMNPWQTLALIWSTALAGALSSIYLATPYTFELFVSKIPILRDDPFVHILFGVLSDPNKYAYWQFLTTTAVMAPVGYTTICFLISFFSGEWFKRRETAIHQMKGAAYHLLISAPIMSYWFQKFVSGQWGKLYHVQGSHSIWYEAVVTPVCYWVITDASFYWQHRIFHSKTLYMYFHAYHHKCRPITTFCGNSAGFVEVHTVEFCHALMPALFLPIHAKSWVLLALGNQAWTIYLHTFDECGVSRLPGWLYDCRDHHVHHYYGIKNYNYGLFFQFWDRVAGTYLDREAVDAKAVARSRAGRKPVDEQRAVDTAKPTKQKAG